MLVLSLRPFEKKKYVAYDGFHGNGPYGEIPTKKEPIRTLGFVVPCCARSVQKRPRANIPQYGSS